MKLQLGKRNSACILLFCIAAIAAATGLWFARVSLQQSNLRMSMSDAEWQRYVETGQLPEGIDASQFCLKR